LQIIWHPTLVIGTVFNDGKNLELLEKLLHVPCIQNTIRCPKPGRQELTIILKRKEFPVCFSKETKVLRRDFFPSWICTILLSFGTCNKRGNYYYYYYYYYSTFGGLGT
jgi:hypothetical protein